MQRKDRYRNDQRPDDDVDERANDLKTPPKKLVDLTWAGARQNTEASDSTDFEIACFGDEI